MNKRDELIVKYAADLKNKFDVMVDMDLLTKVAVSLGPSIYNADSSTVSSSDEKELAAVKNRFLIKKLGLPDSTALDKGIATVMHTYGKSNRNKYRAVVYYMLIKYFEKESAY